MPKLYHLKEAAVAADHNKKKMKPTKAQALAAWRRRKAREYAAEAALIRDWTQAMERAA